MYNFKALIYVLLIFVGYEVYGQKTIIKASFIVNGKDISNVKYYLINDEDAFIQEYRDGNIILKNALSDNMSFLAVYENHKALIPIVRSNEVLYIKVYYDNRIFNNLIRKKFNRPFFKHLLKRDYLIDLGLDDVFTTFKLKRKYNFIE